MQTFFCCGRMIKSAMLATALEEAYANRQMKGKFPGCVLHIDLPLHQVDVNVHPAKTVVKFAAERAVFSAVHHVVRDALDRAGQPPPPSKPVSAAVNPRGDFFQTMDAKTFREKSAAPALASGGRRVEPELGKRAVFRDGGLTAPAVSARDVTVHTVSARQMDPAPILPQDKVSPEPVKVQAALDLPEQTSLQPPREAPWQFRGEILRTYIIAEDGDTVWLIDKHAAHERINFDRLKANPEPVMRQQLLAPAAVDLAQEQYAALLENLPLLEEFGFTAEDFGEGCLMVRAIPSDIDTGQIRQTLEMLADKLLTGGADPAAARDALLHTLACQAAIKGGWTSDPAELRSLMARVQSGEVQYCPHGRPVKIKISKYDIEKMFKRA